MCLNTCWSGCGICRCGLCKWPAWGRPLGSQPVLSSPEIKKPRHKLSLWAEPRRDACPPMMDYIPLICDLSIHRVFGKPDAHLYDSHYKFSTVSRSFKVPLVQAARAPACKNYVLGSGCPCSTCRNYILGSVATPFPPALI